MSKFVTVHSTNAKFAGIWKKNLYIGKRYFLWYEDVWYFLQLFLYAPLKVNHAESSFTGPEYKTRLVSFPFANEINKCSFLVVTVKNYIYIYIYNIG